MKPKSAIKKPSGSSKLKRGAAIAKLSLNFEEEVGSDSDISRSSFNLMADSAADWDKGENLETEKISKDRNLVNEGLKPVVWNDNLVVSFEQSKGERGSA